jgi:hypothetical protein
VDNVSLRNSSIVRIGLTGSLSFYTMPLLRLTSGRTEQAVAFQIASAPFGVAPPSSSRRQVRFTRVVAPLVFYWFTLDNLAATNTSEMGLGTIDVSNPTSLTEYAAQYPGDPLYSSALTIEPLNYGLASSNTPPYVWVYVHSRPASSSSQEFVAGYRYPFNSAAPITSYPIGTMTATDYLNQNLAIGAYGDNDWSGGGGVGEIFSWGTEELSLSGMLPYSTHPDNSSLWVTGDQIKRFTYSGTQEGSFAIPFATNPGSNYARDEVYWSLSRDSIKGIFYFLRLSSAGQWNVYGVQSPLGIGLVAPESAIVDDGGTVWGTFWNFGARPQYSVLVSMNSNVTATTVPNQISLASGQSATVSISETTGGTSFIPALPDGCPLSVTGGAAPGTFVVTATASLSGTCGVLFTDPGNVSVWLPVEAAGQPAGRSARSGSQAPSGLFGPSQRIPIFGKLPAR